MADEMTIKEVDGVPLCAEDECGSFDGKRCALIGHRPGVVCVPYVKLMGSSLATATAAIKVLRAERDIIRTLCSRAELLGGGRVATREIVAVLDTVSGTDGSGGSE